VLRPRSRLVTVVPPLAHFMSDLGVFVFGYSVVVVVVVAIYVRNRVFAFPLSLLFFRFLPTYSIVLFLFLILLANPAVTCVPACTYLIIVFICFFFLFSKDSRYDA
jgi:hypothetical protein